MLFLPSIGVPRYTKSAYLVRLKAEEDTASI